MRNMLVSFSGHGVFYASALLGFALQSIDFLLRVSVTLCLATTLMPNALAGAAKYNNYAFCGRLKN